MSAKFYRVPSIFPLRNIDGEYSSLPIWILFVLDERNAKQHEWGKGRTTKGINWCYLALADICRFAPICVLFNAPARMHRHAPISANIRWYLLISIPFQRFQNMFFILLRQCFISLSHTLKDYTIYFVV